jgi:hypothetical protein
MIILSALSAYITANLTGVIVRLTPVLLFAAVLLVQWYTSTAFQRAGLVVVTVAAVVAGLDIAGKLPVISAVSKACSADESDAQRP